MVFFPDLFYDAFKLEPFKLCELHTFEIHKVRSNLTNHCYFYESCTLIIIDVQDLYYRAISMWCT